MLNWEQAEEIAKIINATSGMWAEVPEHELSDKITKETYVVRYGSQESDDNNLVLMGDYGITWEPSRAYPTTQLATIEHLTVDEAVERMLETADDYYED